MRKRRDASEGERVTVSIDVCGAGRGFEHSHNTETGLLIARVAYSSGTVLGMQFLLGL